MNAFIESSPVCEYAKEVFTKMVDLGNEKGWEFWMSDQIQTKELINQAVEACYLTKEWEEDQELYEGDIQWLIEKVN